ncbi:HalOD1 output domain-containing protein [Halostella litorea]|uniref:HalOD1 output domain-containing protein n=1 Tax=Halostella litorea TaxID=2528831 RepID=UPI00109218B7|nr:HalOD1 output domain-containing protein [Halostella litorea]
MAPRQDGTESGTDAPGVHTVRVDLDAGGSPSDAVVTAVASVRGEDPTALDPLHESIDGDALDTLFADVSDDAGGYVEFTYAGYDVIVKGDGRVVVAETE